MGLFKRWEQRWMRSRSVSQPAEDPSIETAEPSEPAVAVADEAVEPAVPPEPAEPVITVARTLVKSEPELAQLVASESRLQGDGLGVTLVEKGFGTRVELTAPADSGIAEDYLESLLDELAEPQKRPFTAN